MDESVTAVDLFCGGGGLSEGFRQAGIEVTHAVDIEPGACETYALNHPEADVIEADVLELEPGDLPSDVDLLIGSPPCTEFSWANAGGGGDIEEGMILVKRFLYFVAELEPEYWVMENVPRLDTYLPTSIDHADIPGLDSTGTIELEKHVLDGDQYGTPQRRSRLFSGEFPCPEPTNEPVPSFGDIREHFPRPTDPDRPDPDRLITDPTYDIEIPESELTDHFYNSHVTNREAEEIRRRKEDHSFYGKMSFPDDPDVPSRTVLATNRRVARETLVMAEETAPEGLSPYRKPTIREIGAIQGFPITYQFTGSSQAQKWRRVGDAVPPTMAFPVARAIQQDAGVVDGNPAPNPNETCPPIETNLNDRDTSWKGRRSLSISRNLRHHIPLDNKHAFRVDIESDKDTQPPHPLTTVIDADEAPTELFQHPVEFGVQLYRGYSSDVVSKHIELEEAATMVEATIAQHPELADRVYGCLRDLRTELGPEIPDATTLQAIRSRRHERDEPIEYDLMARISSYEETGIVDRYFPKADYESLTTGLPELFDGTQLPIRVLLKTVGGVYLTTKLDHCSRWLHQNPSSAYLQVDEEDDEALRDHLTETQCTFAAPDSTANCIDTWLANRFPEPEHDQTTQSTASTD